MNNRFQWKGCDKNVAVLERNMDLNQLSSALKRLF